MAAKGNGSVKTKTETKNRLPDEAKAASGDIRVAVRCKGITPLLMNPLTDDVLMALWTKEKGSKTAPRPTIQEAAEKKAEAYRDSDGNYFVPVSAVYACLKHAGRDVRLDGRKQVSTATSTKMSSFMTLDAAQFILEGLDPERPWEADARPGKNPNGGEAVCIVRPRFDKWGFTANITIFADEISEETIRELFDKAGRRAGLLDFRPQRGGVFGQFVVEEWTRL
jgi:hypothetical protein